MPEADILLVLCCDSKMSLFCWSPFELDSFFFFFLVWFTTVDLPDRDELSFCLMKKAEKERRHSKTEDSICRGLEV